ncbi:hypothetical protein DFP72DRAFT_810150 [Ephemerocybe angulata]|uniref:Transmembrane protein n=1 Tax=Ephemerocybe angulata TaxID=980116 RepID=A0A8H6I172_9AGAR|nr:hypothetical protein DFP72DRAFT_810150 [Tulosesus angulatus]
MTVLAAPAPAAATPSRTASATEGAVHQYDPVDEFFGYRFASSATHESRHDSHTQSLALDRDVEALPAYEAEDTSLPAYSAYAEPITLAMYLFKFGFLFPPFWIFGAFILLSPLREPPTSEASPVWMPEKTEAERQQIIEQMRTVEIKWAKRCLYALLITLVLAGLAVVGAWALLVRKA